MRLALAQLNPLVGDLPGNGQKIRSACRQAARAGADLVLTPELSLWGYPPRDLLLRPSLVAQQARILDQLAEELAEGPAVLVGVAEPIGDSQVPRLHNALALVRRGGWTIACRKRLLPTYDVFDERRYFRPGQAAEVLELDLGGRPWRLGLTICEDLWVEEELQGHRLAGSDPIAELLSQGIELLLNLSASPYGQGKPALRRDLAARAALRLGCPVLYVNQVGGNDELVFDGASFVVDRSGAPCLAMACAEEQLAIWDSDAASPWPGPAAGSLTSAPPGIPPATASAASGAFLPLLLSSVREPCTEEQLLRVLVLGLGDYTRKCGFSHALLGLSGGIDSALVAVIASAALGAERIRALLMPSPYSSRGSIDDASDLAGRLGLTTSTVPISTLMTSFDAALTGPLQGPPAELTEENLQSRIRGTLLMAVANQEGRLLLSTGNKSELAVGYCTLYGDMNGGLAVIGDLYKSTVFRLCDWIDSTQALPCRRSLGLPAEGALIGPIIRQKPPSAELRPDQKDSDSLPDYAVLDPLLKASIEDLASPEELIAAGTDPALAERVHQLLRRAEFKRRQAAPTLKVSGRSFGAGWRMPIAAA